MTSNMTRRLGLSRFMVPHTSYDWYMRNIALGTLATAALLGLFTWLYHRELFESMGLASLSADPMALERFSRLSLTSTGIVILSGTLYVTLLAAFLFHRVAGPIYRIEQHMRQIIDGDSVSELKIRETDQLSDFCQTYNQLLYTLDVIEAKPLEPADDDDAGPSESETA